MLYLDRGRRNIHKISVFEELFFSKFFSLSSFSPFFFAFKASSRDMGKILFFHNWSTVIAFHVYITRNPTADCAKPPEPSTKRHSSDAPLEENVEKLVADCETKATDDWFKLRARDVAILTVEKCQIHGNLQSTKVSLFALKCNFVCLHKWINF